MRRVVTDCSNGYFTQGSIFSCLENSAGNQTYGVIITARCDLEHEKINKVVCLPVYKLKDWMTLYGDEEIYESSLSSVINQLDVQLKKYGTDVEKYKIFGLDEIEKYLVQKKIDTKSQEFINQCFSFINEKNVFAEIKSLKENNKKYFESLLNHSKASAYFIEGLLGDDSEGFVIDLSEPISLPLQVLKDISRTLHFQKFNRLKNSIYKNMMLKEEQCSSFHNVIASPYIEHILQRFSQFYSRIGTDDISEDTRLIIKDVYEKR